MLHYVQHLVIINNNIFCDIFILIYIIYIIYIIYNIYNTLRGDARGDAEGKMYGFGGFIVVFK